MHRALLLAVVILSGVTGCQVGGGGNTCGDCGPCDDCGSAGACSPCDHCKWLSKCGLFRGCCGCCSEELGCGEMFWGDWFDHPPSRCQPCDQCGNWTGPPPYPARGHAPRYQTVARR